MDTGWDIDMPVGYWVRQVRSDGQMLAVKVMHTVHRAANTTNGEAFEPPPTEEGPEL